VSSLRPTVEISGAAVRVAYMELSATLSFLDYSSTASDGVVNLTRSLPAPAERVTPAEIAAGHRDKSFPYLGGKAGTQ